MDLILGQFADAHLEGFDAVALGEFEDLLNEPDPEVQAWLMGQAPVPADRAGPVLDRLLAFRLPGTT